MSEHRLHYARKEGLRAAEAAAHAVSLLGDVYAIAYTPAACVLARTDGGALRDSAGREIPTDAFELRCFSSQGELRWLHEGDGLGAAVLVTADEALAGSAAGAGFAPLPSLACCGTIEHDYVLWGTATGRDVAPGWSEVAEPRIGSLAVPVEGLPERGRAAIAAVEHLRIEDEHGNVGVADELLVGLHVQPAEEV